MPFSLYPLAAFCGSERRGKKPELMHDMLRTPNNPFQGSTAHPTPVSPQPSPSLSRMSEGSGLEDEEAFHSADPSEPIADSEQGEAEEEEEEDAAAPLSKRAKRQWVVAAASRDFDI